MAGETAAASAAGAAAGGPIGAALPWIFKGASLLGGLFGKKKKKIDINWLSQHMGPAALAARTQEIANNLLNSAYGQKLLTSAAEQGSRFASDMAGRAAAAGLSPDTGGQSPVADFTTSAAEGAGAGFRRDVESGIYQQAAPIAQEQLNTEYEAYLKNLDLENSQPSLMSRIGNVASQVAAQMKPKPTAGEVMTGQGQVAAAPNAALSTLAAAPQMQMQPAVIPSAFARPNPFVARALAMDNPTMRMLRQKRQRGGFTNVAR